MIDLTGKSALVTGGARGIGKAICLNLARQGADIAFLDIGRPEVAEATVAEIEALGRRALYIPADVTDPEACVKAVADRCRLRQDRHPRSTTPASPATT